METCADLQPRDRSIQRWMSCRRKRRYETMKAARRALLTCWKKGMRRGRHERSFYACEYCDGFHLTSKEPNGTTRLT